MRGGPSRVVLPGAGHESDGENGSPPRSAALLSETHRRPDLLAALHDTVFQPRGRELRAMLRDASDHGEIRPEVIDSHLVDLGHEMVMFRFLAEGPPVPDKTIISILDDVALPLLRPPGAERTLPGGDQAMSDQAS